MPSKVKTKTVAVKRLSAGQTVKFDVRDVADMDFGGEDYDVVKQFDAPRYVTGVIETLPPSRKKNNKFDASGNAVVLLTRTGLQ
jgi:hypothetical protein